MRPKRIGVVGGMGSRAGAALFSKLIDYSPAVKDQDFPEITVHSNSNIADRTEAILYRMESPLPELVRSIRFLNLCDVDVIIMACITSYFYYHHLVKATNAKLIHPVDLVIRFLKARYPAIKSIGLLATTGTIKSGLFKKQCEENDLTLLTLDDVSQEKYFMKSVYMNGGLKSSIISEEARNLMITAAEKLKQQGAQVLIGGCTEVQLAIKEGMFEIPFVDVTDVMAREVINYCFGKESLIVEANNLRYAS